MSVRVRGRQQGVYQGLDLGGDGVLGEGGADGANLATKCWASASKTAASD